MPKAKKASKIRPDDFNSVAKRLGCDPSMAAFDAKLKNREGEAFGFEKVTAQSSDLALLHGKWLQVDFEENGVSNPPDDHGAPGAVTTFSENHFEVRTVDGVLLLEGSFELNPLSIPKAVDWIDAIGPDAGKRLPAIYRLEKDRFIFVAANEGAPRPETFRTVPGQTMRTFIRKT